MHWIFILFGSLSVFGAFGLAMRMPEDTESWVRIVPIVASLFVVYLAYRLVITFRNGNGGDSGGNPQPRPPEPSPEPPRPPTPELTYAAELQTANPRLDPLLGFIFVAALLSAIAFIYIYVKQHIKDFPANHVFGAISAPLAAGALYYLRKLAPGLKNVLPKNISAIFRKPKSRSNEREPNDLHESDEVVPPSGTNSSNVPAPKAGQPPKNKQTPPKNKKKGDSDDGGSQSEFPL